MFFVLGSNLKTAILQVFASFFFTFAFCLSHGWNSWITRYLVSLKSGDVNFGKMQQINPNQLAFRCSINIHLLTHSLTYLKTKSTVSRTKWILGFDWLTDSWIDGLQDASVSNSRDAFAKFVQSATESARHCTLRGQLEFVIDECVKPVALAEVESAASIVKRFCTGPFGFGLKRKATESDSQAKQIFKLRIAMAKTHYSNSCCCA